MIYAHIISHLLNLTEGPIFIGVRFGDISLPFQGEAIYFEGFGFSIGRLHYGITHHSREVDWAPTFSVSWPQIVSNFLSS